MTDKEKIKLLEEVLHAICDIDIGIYPKSLKDNENPDRSYFQRTRYMEGWNQAIIKIIGEQNKIYKRFRIALVADGKILYNTKE